MSSVVFCVLLRKDFIMKYQCYHCFLNYSTEHEFAQHLLECQKRCGCSVCFQVFLLKEDKKDYQKEDYIAIDIDVVEQPPKPKQKNNMFLNIFYSFFKLL